jgi:hypothetical protein
MIWLDSIGLEDVMRNVSGFSCATVKELMRELSIVAVLL